MTDPETPRQRAIRILRACSDALERQHAEASRSLPFDAPILSMGHSGLHPVPETPPPFSIDFYASADESVSLAEVIALLEDMPRLKLVNDTSLDLTLSCEGNVLTLHLKDPRL